MKFDKRIGEVLTRRTDEFSRSDLHCIYRQVL